MASKAIGGKTKKEKWITSLLSRTGADYSRGSASPVKPRKNKAQRVGEKKKDGNRTPDNFDGFNVRWPKNRCARPLKKRS